VQALATTTPIIIIIIILKRWPRLLHLIITCTLNNIGQTVRNAPRPQGSPRCNSQAAEALLGFKLYRKIREFSPMIRQFPNWT
jgi:hypothetical protein